LELADLVGTPDRSSAFTAEQQRQRAQSKLIWEPYLKQTFVNAFSSPDLVHWTRHDHVLDVANVAWAAYAVWAPSAIEHKGKYYLFFGANDIKSNGQPGGIGEIRNGAQPIDQMVFKDDDGQIYMYYGGWKHANVVKLAPDLLSLVPFPDGETFKEITPDPAYVEGPFTDDWYIAYHRRPLNDDDGHHRELAIEHLYFNEDGTIRPVRMSTEGVAARRPGPAD
jgi:hypothetical protein